MVRKTDIQIDLLREILSELRRINVNLERRRVEHDSPKEEKGANESEDMDEFE